MNAETEWQSNLDEEVRFWRSLFDKSCPNRNHSRQHGGVLSEPWKELLGQV